MTTLQLVWSARDQLGMKMNIMFVNNYYYPVYCTYSAHTVHTHTCIQEIYLLYNSRIFKSYKVDLLVLVLDVTSLQYLLLTLLAASSLPQPEDGRSGRWGEAVSAVPGVPADHCLLWEQERGLVWSLWEVHGERRREGEGEASRVLCV